MAETTGIQWTNHTWNPWRGCTMVSPGCANCYMFTEQRRYGHDPAEVMRTKTWGAPLKWQKAAALAGRTEMVFTCSWSDFFHETADPWRNEAWDVIRRCPNLIFQILTKRPERITGHLPIDWPRGGYPNVWLGVSVENQATVDERIPLLLQTPAAVRFLSCEPLLDKISLSFEIGTRAHLPGCLLDFIDWVIVGGESGPKARPCDVAWTRSIVKQCKAAGVACFMKQLGSNPVFGPDHDPNVKVNAGRRWGTTRDPKGGDPAEWPEDLRIREFPRITLADTRPAFAPTPLAPGGKEPEVRP